MTDEERLVSTLEMQAPCPSGSHWLTVKIQIVASPDIGPRPALPYIAFCDFCQKSFKAKEIPLLMELLRATQELILEGPSQSTVYVDDEPVYGDDYSVEKFLEKQGNG